MHKEGQKRPEKKKIKERKKKTEPKVIVHALRAQAESRGDKVAVCWHDQSYDMSRGWTNTRRTTRQDKTEGKTKQKRREKKRAETQS